LTPGISLETLLSEGAKLGHWDGASVVGEFYVADAWERHRNLPSSFEIRYGDGRWIRQSKRRTASGGIGAIFTDITELKKAEERLEQIKVAIDNIAEAVSIYDPDDRLV